VTAACRSRVATLTHLLLCLLLAVSVTACKTYRINAGGAAVSPFAVDGYWSGAACVAASTTASVLMDSQYRRNLDLRSPAGAAFAGPEASLPAYKPTPRDGSGVKGRRRRRAQRVYP